MKMRNVLVTTDSSRRGVFAGQLVKETSKTVELKNARMIVYWSTDVRGVLGLAATGPTASCRITKAVPKLKINGVTAIVDMTKEAVKAFEKEPWG